MKDGETVRQTDPVSAICGSLAERESLPAAGSCRHGVTGAEAALGPCE
jgi:hypothetical protein